MSTVLKQQSDTLTQDQVRFFQENGYIHLKNVLDPWELQRLDSETRRMIDYCQDKGASPPNDDYLYGMDPVTGKMVLRRVNKMYLKGDYFFGLWAQPRLMGTAASLLGPDIISVDDAMVVKMPEYGIAVRWHRDPAFPRVKPLVNLGVYLDAATPENGCLYVVPGSHLWQGFDPQDMLDEHGFRLPGAIPVITEPGDVVAHSVNVLHGSRITRGKGTRRVIYVAYDTIEETLARGADAEYVRSRVKVMLKTMSIRAKLPETANEKPFRWAPTMPEFKLDPDDLGYVEDMVKPFRQNHDPNYSYSPLVTVNPKT